MYYTEKLVMSGGFLEHYKYSVALRRDFKEQKEEEKKVKAKQLQMDFVLPDIVIGKRNDSIARTRTAIRRLVNSNTDFDKFTTLTFAENLTDIKKANLLFTKFIKRLYYRFGEFKYLAVIEFQKRGAVHYHFLNNLPFIDSNELANIWGHGFVKPKYIKGCTNLGAYVCKYLSKDEQNPQMFNRKKYFCSRNIEKPVFFFDSSKVRKIKDFYNLDCLQPVYKAVFDNKYSGTVQYSQYSISHAL